jgi:MFS family permease
MQNGSLGAFCTLFIIASAAGMVCTVLLVKQPEPPKDLAPRHGRFFKLYLAPFKQPNFRRLLRFSVIWQFAFNVASPFFVVYTLAELGASYALAATYTVIHAIFELLGMRVWGHISDRTGNKPVITIAAAVISAVPWIWLFTLKNSFTFYWLLPVLYAAGGFFWAAYNLCSTNIMFRLAPRERSSVYFGAWAACNGLAACAGSLLGGVMGKWAAQHHLKLFFFSLAGLKIVFLLTGVLRIAAAFSLRPIKEVQALRTRQALRLLRHARNWRLMLQEDVAAPANFAEEKFWPLFRRKSCPSFDQE